MITEEESRQRDMPHATTFYLDGPLLGRTVVYSFDGKEESNMPGIILAQSGDIADVAVFTYGHQYVVQCGARFMMEKPKLGWNGVGGNVCWLVP